MTDEFPDTAPALGPSTDTDIGEDTAANLIRGQQPETAGATEQTMSTPDELGGTGGEPAGGAG